VREDEGVRGYGKEEKKKGVPKERTEGRRCGVLSTYCVYKDNGYDFKKVPGEGRGKE